MNQSARKQAHRRLMWNRIGYCQLLIEEEVESKSENVPLAGHRRLFTLAQHSWCLSKKVAIQVFNASQMVLFWYTELMPNGICQPLHNKMPAFSWSSVSIVPAVAVASGIRIVQNSSTSLPVTQKISYASMSAETPKQNSAPSSHPTSPSSN